MTNLWRVVAAVVLLVTGADHCTVAGAYSRTSKCPRERNDRAGKYADCRLKAEARFAFGGSAKGREAALQKCNDLYGVAWAKEPEDWHRYCGAELKEVRTFIDVYTRDLTRALAGGALPDCPTDLAACQTDLAACTGGSPMGQLLRTGQVQCWNEAGLPIACAGTGQDGELQRGLARAYLDNGDGTITDTRTGLMWEKLSNDRSIHDWDDIYTWEEAFRVKIAQLNTGGGFAGYTDWRLPNWVELRSLYDYGTALVPPIVPEFNTACPPGCTTLTCSCTPSSFQWTSSNSGLGQPARAESFSSDPFGGTTPYLNFARAVRGGGVPAPPAPVGQTVAARKCQSDKNKQAGKYARCRHKAEGRYVTNPVETVRTAALEKCADRYSRNWLRTESRSGGECPSTDDLQEVETFVDVATDAVAEELTGGVLPACLVARATCEADLAACDAGAPLSRLRQTGQVLCWDGVGKAVRCGGTGQDGELQHGLRPQFVDNGDGTITDTRTGLMWEKLSDDGSIHDRHDTYTWGGAFGKIAALNGGGGFAGYTDWRLPNAIELESTAISYDLKYFGDSVPPEFDAGCQPQCTVFTCSCTSAGPYYISGTWSSTTNAASPDRAWSVGYDPSWPSVGGARRKTDAAFVRAVRGGS